MSEHRVSLCFDVSWLFCFKTKLYASLGFSISGRNELTKEHLFDIIILSLA
nr:MAG TPA: hypothetical protein [Caudoviricetes sp.]